MKIIQFSLALNTIKHNNIIKIYRHNNIVVGIAPNI